MVVAPRYGEYAEGWETGVRRQMQVFGGDQQVNNLNTTKPQTSMRLSSPAAHAVLLYCVTQETCMVSLDAAKTHAGLRVAGLQSCTSLAPKDVIGTMNLCAFA